MLGFIPIIIIGQQFYLLAKRKSKNKWLYVLLGVVSYYLGTIIGLFLIVFSYLAFGIT